GRRAPARKSELRPSLTRMGWREQEYRRRDDARPLALPYALRGRNDRKRIHDEVAHLVNPLAFVPSGIRIELDIERRGQHRGCQILDVVAGFRLRHAETVVCGNVTVMRRIFRPRQTNTGRDVATAFVGLGAGHDAEGYLPW